MFGLGHDFSSIKALPAPDKRAQQRNKGMSENIQSLSSQYVSINLRKTFEFGIHLLTNHEELKTLQPSP